VGQWVSMMAIDHMHTMPGTCHSHSVQLSWCACQYHFWNAWWISGCQVPCLGTWHLAGVLGTWAPGHLAPGWCAWHLAHGTWACGHLVTWHLAGVPGTWHLAPGHVVTWSPGTWLVCLAPGHLGTWHLAPGHLAPGTWAP